VDFFHPHYQKWPILKRCIYTCRSILPISFGPEFWNAFRNHEQIRDLSSSQQ